MSFSCYRCGQPQPAGTSPINTVLLVREVRYQVKPKTAKKLGLPKGSPYTTGYETVLEADLCDQCHNPNLGPGIARGQAKEVRL